MTRPYHHGDLRQSLLTEALLATAEHGPTGWSMRELARRVGVSHAASNRHFADKQALVTALARDAFRDLATELEAADQGHRRLYDVGQAYVRFATQRPAEFAIANRPELYDADDSEIDADRSRVFATLYGAAAQLGVPDPESAGITAWALVHGLAELHLNGMLPASMGTPLEAFRTASTYFLGPPPPERA